MEQDQRGIKQRYYPMRGFGSFASMARFCSARDEVRDHCRQRTTLSETTPLAVQWAQFGSLTTPPPALTPVQRCLQFNAAVRVPRSDAPRMEVSMPAVGSEEER